MPGYTRVFFVDIVFLTILLHCAKIVDLSQRRDPQRSSLCVFAQFPSLLTKRFAFSHSVLIRFSQLTLLLGVLGCLRRGHYFTGAM